MMLAQVVQGGEGRWEGSHCDEGEGPGEGPGESGQIAKCSHPQARVTWHDDNGHQHREQSTHALNPCECNHMVQAW